MYFLWHWPGGGRIFNIRMPPVWGRDDWKMQAMQRAFNKI